MFQLTQLWLDRGRLRSAPEQYWLQDKAWADLVWTGKSLATHEIERWLELSGCEIDGGGFCAKDGTGCESGETSDER